MKQIEKFKINNDSNNTITFNHNRKLITYNLSDKEEITGCKKIIEYWKNNEFDLIGEECSYFNVLEFICLNTFGYKVRLIKKGLPKI